MRQGHGEARSGIGARLPIFFGVLALLEFALAPGTGSAAAAADRHARQEPGRLWKEFPLASVARPRTTPPVAQPAAPEDEAVAKPHREPAPARPQGATDKAKGRAATDTTTAPEAPPKPKASAAEAGRGAAQPPPPRSEPGSATTTTNAFVPPLATPEASRPSSSGGRIYLTPLLILFALAFLTAVVWRDARLRRLASVRRNLRTQNTKRGRGGIRYRD
jgi:cobalamin biosynthesis Mg chelatase CobN